jgi:pimeloyl-ACP methyl ester carboxylesterase
MMIAEQEVALTNRHGDVINATLTLPPAGQSNAVPLLVVLHGFKGFRNYSFLPWVAQYAASHGMAVLRICFSLNGMRNTSWLVQSTEDFARNTISRECDDAADVLAALTSESIFDGLRSVWDGTVSLLGHSRGGGIAMIAGKELLASHPAVLRKVAVWNSVGTWNRWTPRQAEAWKAAGTFEMQNQRTLQTLNMHSSYLEDIENNSARLDLITASKALDGRLRFVHAQHDLTVPLREIEEVAHSSSAIDALRIIQNTTHTFGMEHPVQRITPGIVEALANTFPWIAQ